MNEFKSARGRTTAITVLVIAQLVTLAGTIAAWLVYSQSLDSGDVSGVATVINALNPIDQLLFLAAFIVYLTWIYRATANLPALGSLSGKYTPAMAVWWYFIPFANLVQGHGVMANVWRESQPAAVDEHGFAIPRKASLVHWWWGLYIGTAVVSHFLTDSKSLDVEALRSVAHGQIFFRGLQLAEGVLFMLMVRAAQKRQEEQWLDLERRRNVPQPTADALR
jgi:Domain of unknown function (DUF4328)